LSSVLFVGPFDVLAFAMAFTVLLGVAAFANAVPAWRASRVDAMIALRHD
jgi:ABC-type antimicrobial peptide transport system permease subunit